MEPTVATLGSIRGMANLLDEVERMPETPSVPVLVALLRSTDEGERDDALASLAEMVDGAFGEDGEQLGLAVRANGGVALLSWLLADPSPDVQQMSLMIIGNLCSDSVDANSKETKRLLLQSGGARAILSCAFTEDPAVLLFACGALQNLCFEVAWSELAVSHDVHKRLEGLLFHEDAMIVRYASGALQNITRALELPEGLSDLAMEAVKERCLEHQREEWLQQRATSKIAQALAAIPMDVRQRRHDKGTRRRQRAAQLDSSSGSRPSSAASSRSTSSYVSARSSATSSAASGGPAGLAPAQLAPPQSPPVTYM